MICIKRNRVIYSLILMSFQLKKIACVEDDVWALISAKLPLYDFNLDIC